MTEAGIAERHVANRRDRGAEEAARHKIERSPEWERVAKDHLKRHPSCACCKSPSPDTPVQVHHIFPFHYCIALGRPDLELDPRNLITLCETEAGRPAENHHLLIGHLDDFKSSNLRVVRDATETFYGLSAEHIKSDHRWLAEKVARLKPLDEMTEQDKEDFKSAMNAAFPRR